LRFAPSIEVDHFFGGFQNMSAAPALLEMALAFEVAISFQNVAEMF
jgi:hypothetical protein